MIYFIGWHQPKRQPTMLKKATAILLAFILFSPLTAWAVSPCGTLRNAYGPFDYTNPDHKREKLQIVEDHHFMPRIENLDSYLSRTYLFSNLNYTLRAFPNHYRALFSMMNAQLKFKKIRKIYTMECYFERAIQFKGVDGRILMLRGYYRHKKGDLDKALTDYLQAVKLLPKSSEAFNNLGLLYFDMKNYAAAKQAAVRAYELGYPLPGLKNKLKKQGRWDN